MVAPLTRVTLTRDQSFFYILPESMEVTIGSLVDIPFGRRSVMGIVTDSMPDTRPPRSMKIKSISNLQEYQALTSRQITLAQSISNTYLCPLGPILTLCVQKKIKERAKTTPPQSLNLTPFSLPTSESQLLTDILKAQNSSILLNAAGSQHTSTFLTALIEQVLVQNSSSQITIIAPERTQTVALIKHLENIFPTEHIAMVSDLLSGGAQSSAWQRIKDGSARIIIGTKRALFAPYQELSHILFLQCHDMAYKQWQTQPLYDARDVVTTLQEIHNATLIRVSDSPRVTDRFLAEQSKSYHTLAPDKKRVLTINMREAYWKHNEKRTKKVRPLISEDLYAQISNTIRAGQKTLLFVNRQGKNSFSVCAKCKEVVRCPTCEYALTERSKGNFTCLHCNHQTDVFPSCTSCGNLTFTSVGMGTEAIEEELSRRIPGSVIVRIDQSLIKTSKDAQKIYDKIQDPKCNIIIGTQMMTKSTWSQNVGLAAVLDMDTLLSSVDYDAHEKALAHILQLSARLRPGGTLLVQSYDLLHPIMDTVHTLQKSGPQIAYDTFYEDESSMRQILQFPPYQNLISLTGSHKDLATLEKNADTLYNQLADIPDIIVTEPHAPRVSTRRGSHYIRIIIKYKQELPASARRVLLGCDRSWSVDVHPESIS